MQLMVQEREGMNEPPRQKLQSFYNLILEVKVHHFCIILYSLEVS